MNILITGGAGYIGSFLVKRCVERGDTVVVVDDMSGGNESAVSKDAILVFGDCGDKELIRRLCGMYCIDLVMHTAASVSPEGSLTEPSEYFRNNVLNTMSLLNAMLECGVKKMIYSSSACVFGEPSRNPVAEEDRKEPLTAYGESKLMVEPILKWYRMAYGLQYVAFRYFNVAGADGDLGSHKLHYGVLIPNILKVVLGQLPYVSVYGGNYPTKDGSCVRDYVHIKDIVGAHELVMSRVGGLDGICGVYNLGSGVETTVLEVIKEACQTLSHDISFDVVGGRDGDPAVLVADVRKAKSVLGWVPRYSLAEILCDAWVWAEAHPHGYDCNETEVNK